MVVFASSPPQRRRISPPTTYMQRILAEIDDTFQFGNATRRVLSWYDNVFPPTTKPASLAWIALRRLSPAIVVVM